MRLRQSTPGQRLPPSHGVSKRGLNLLSPPVSPSPGNARERTLGGHWEALPVLLALRSNQGQEIADAHPPILPLTT